MLSNLIQRERCRRAHDRLIDPIRRVARSYGYAIAVHGSLSRDLDYVAIPWARSCATAEVLVEAIRIEVESITETGQLTVCDTHKPHGRRAWVILFGVSYIDLSVMPV